MKEFRSVSKLLEEITKQYDIISSHIYLPKIQKNIIKIIVLSMEIRDSYENEGYNLIIEEAKELIKKNENWPEASAKSAVKPQD